MVRFGWLLESHIWLYFINLAWEVNVLEAIVSLKVIELVGFESLIDVLLFDSVSMYFQDLVEMHDTNIIIGLCNPTLSVEIWLEVVYSFDFSKIKIFLEAHVFCEFS